MAAAIKFSVGHQLIPSSSSAASSLSTISRYSTWHSDAPSTSVSQGCEVGPRRISQVICIAEGLTSALVGAKCSFRSRGWLASSRKAVGRMGFSNVEGHGSRAASGSQGSSTKILSEFREAPVLLGVLNHRPTEFEHQQQYQFEGGERGPLGPEQRRLLEGIERVISKDRQWLEEALAVNLGGARGGEAWNLNGRLLVAVPGVTGLNLSGPQSVLEALGVLAAIITVHEAGHFLAARLQNIHVTKFAVGFGPTLAKFQKHDVEYSLRAFPFGGFVAFPDDDPESQFAPDDPNLLKNRPLLDRALVISAGVIANLIFAYSVLFVQTLGVGLVEMELSPGVVVPEVLNKSAAAKGGMRAGDVILAVDGYELCAKDSAVFELVDTIKRNPGRRLNLVVKRGADVVGLEVTPDDNLDGSGRIGVQLSPNGMPHRVKAENLADAAVKSSHEFGRLTTTVVDGLKQIILNFEKTVDSVSGPVAIVAVGAEVARSDVTGLFQFAAIVNINLAIVNLLPLPALDGGYLAFVLLEAIRGGKKLPDGVEQGIMSSGVLLLLALGIVLMVRDTLNLGFVQQIL